MAVLVIIFSISTERLDADLSEFPDPRSLQKQAQLTFSHLSACCLEVYSLILVT